MKRNAIALLLSVGLVSFANAGEAPQPCGPAGDLSEELSNNVCLLYTSDAADE